MAYKPEKISTKHGARLKSKPLPQNSKSAKHLDTTFGNAEQLF